MQSLPALFSNGFMQYFVQKATIKGIQILYSNEVFGIVWDVDLCLLLEIHKRNGSTYEYQLNIRGCFKKDQSEKIIGWGSNFKIQKLFQSLKVNAVVAADGTIPQNSLDALIGNEVSVLSYISGLKEDGSHKYQMWDILSDNRTNLEDDFQYSNDRGYPKNYQPELLLEENKIQESNPVSDDVDDEFIVSSNDYDNILD